MSKKTNNNFLGFFTMKKGLIIILGAVIDSISLVTENSYPINYEEINYTPVPIVQEANLEKIVEEKIIFNEPKVETRESIADYINEIYKTLQVPDYISKKFIKKIIKKESDNYTHAVSPVGAKGLMQLMQEAWESVDRKNYHTYVFDSKANIEAGVKYFLHLDKYLENNYPNWSNLSSGEKRGLISAAYNGGIGRLEKRNWEIEYMPEETQKYVKDVYTD